MKGARLHSFIPAPPHPAPTHIANMQKLIQRSSAAKREAARRATRQVGARESEHVFQYRQQLKAQKASQAMYVKSERERRRETYEAGVLAPRYDVGESVENFATVDPYVVTGISKAWKHYKDLVIPFAEGDRVVITKGRDKGRIGRIATIDEKAGCVKINGLNMVCNLHLFYPLSLSLSLSP